EMMGLAGELGQLRPGWLADLIVVDGDPVDDIAMLQDRQRIHLVMKDGNIHRNDLGTMATATA
ncbi:MAG TPA: amidohydrolase family protein, partial [Ilumatobacteraceae bacterium]